MGQVCLWEQGWGWGGVGGTDFCHCSHYLDTYPVSNLVLIFLRMETFLDSFWLHRFFTLREYPETFDWNKAPGESRCPEGKVSTYFSLGRPPSVLPASRFLILRLTFEFFSCVREALEQSGTDNTQGGQSQANVCWLAHWSGNEAEFLPLARTQPGLSCLVIHLLPWGLATQADSSFPSRQSPNPLVK